MRNKFKLILIFVLCFLCLVGLYIIFYVNDPYEEIGYNKKEIDLIRKQDANIQRIILDYPYQKDLIKILNEKRVSKKLFEKFFTTNILNPNRYEDVVKVANSDYDWDLYMEREKNPILKDPYYLKRNKERYLSFLSKIDKTKFKDKKDLYRYCVEMVNANADLGFYQKSFKADLSKKNLVLVNKFYYLEDDYQPDDLVPFLREEGQGYIRKETYDAFHAMYLEAKKDGYSIYAQSPFRSYQSQYYLYNRYVLSDGKKAADTYSARAGYSEHQTGLVIDIVEPGTYMEGFENTKAFKWMEKNAADYGFILRYQKEKEDVTGYIYESWHYRYVGKEVAKYIKENKITFDEYYEYFVIGEKQ